MILPLRTSSMDACVEAVIRATRWRVVRATKLVDRGCRAEPWRLEGYDYALAPEGLPLGQHVQFLRENDVVRAGFTLDGLCLHYDRLRISTAFAAGWPLRLSALLRPHLEERGRGAAAPANLGSVQ